jgi:hypothetical protein
MKDKTIPTKEKITITLKPTEFKIGDKVKDEEGHIGTVIECDDIHNIFVQFDDGGSGLFCIDRTCKEFSHLNKINIFDNILVSDRIVVLSGRIAHVNGIKEDLIFRITDEFLVGIDKVIEAINLGYGSVREASLEEKEYWFLCHNNLHEKFMARPFSDFIKWKESK